MKIPLALCSGEANLPHIEIVRLPELLTSNQAEADEDGEAVIDDLIAAALRDNIDTEAPVQPWRTTVRLDSLSADQAAELRDLEKPTDITSQFRSLDHRERSRERVQKSPHSATPRERPCLRSSGSGLRRRKMRQSVTF